MFLCRPRTQQISLKDFISPLDKDKSINPCLAMTWEYPLVDVTVALFEWSKALNAG